MCFYGTQVYHRVNCSATATRRNFCKVAKQCDAKTLPLWTYLSVFVMRLRNVGAPVGNLCIIFFMALSLNTPLVLLFYRSPYPSYLISKLGNPL